MVGKLLKYSMVRRKECRFKSGKTENLMHWMEGYQVIRLQSLIYSQGLKTGGRPRAAGRRGTRECSKEAS